METAVSTWLARPDILGHVPDFIRLAEADLSRELECSFDDVATAGTLDGSGVLPLPADCLYVRRIWTTSNPSQHFNLISPEEGENLGRHFSGLAARFAYRRGTTLVYFPQTSTGYEMDYRKAAAQLGDQPAGGTTGHLTDLYDAILYGSLIHAAPFLKADARLPVWTSIYQHILDGARRMEWKKRTGGMVLQARPYTWA
jgi:hypothetical protein